MEEIIPFDKVKKTSIIGTAFEFETINERRKNESV